MSGGQVASTGAKMHARTGGAGTAGSSVRTKTRARTETTQASREHRSDWFREVAWDGKMEVTES
jgi:single-stranded DNA-binding protein